MTEQTIDVTPNKTTGKPSKKKSAKKSASKAVATAKPKTGTALAPHVPQTPKTFMQVIAEAAADPRCDVAKMQALLDMQAQVEERNATKTFDSAFIALQAELPSIAQDGKIEIRAKENGERTGRVQQATPYATFNGIMKVIKPLLTKHGFGLSFETEQTAGGLLLVRGKLTGHGHERATAFPLPAEASGSKNNVQGWGSSLSYGKRYCTISLLNIVSGAKEDRDTDGHDGEFASTKDGGLAEKPAAPLKASPEQIIKLRDAINLNEVPIQKVLDHYSLAKIEDIEARFVDPAIQSCKDYAANKRARS